MSVSTNNWVKRVKLGLNMANGSGAAPIGELLLTAAVIEVQKMLGIR